MKIGTAFLIIGCFIYCLSCITSLISIDTSIAEYKLSNYNKTDTNNYYFLFLKVNGIEIMKQRNNDDGYPYYSVVECTYGQVKSNKVCGNFTELSEINSISAKVKFNYFLFFFNLFYPIIFVVIQSIISFNDRHNHGDGGFFFKYFRISLFLANISTIISTFLSIYGYDDYFLNISRFMGLSINSLASILTTIITSVGAVFLIISTALAKYHWCSSHHHNHTHQSDYQKI
ncbi:hypothetical protein ACTA71_001618 [Dictyostelium dimigraforme]